jgi:hypothetical protein
LLPTFLAACTTVEPRAPRYLDLGDLWTAQGSACVAERANLVLSVKQTALELVATGVTKTECSTAGNVVWRGTLPRAIVQSDTLPISFDALGLRSRRAQVRRLTMASAEGLRTLRSARVGHLRRPAAVLAAQVLQAAGLQLAAALPGGSRTAAQLAAAGLSQQGEAAVQRVAAELSRQETAAQLVAAGLSQQEARHRLAAAPERP